MRSFQTVLFSILGKFWVFDKNHKKCMSLAFANQLSVLYMTVLKTRSPRHFFGIFFRYILKRLSRPHPVLGDGLICTSTPPPCRPSYDPQCPPPSISRSEIAPALSGLEDGGVELHVLGQPALADRRVVEDVVQPDARRRIKGWHEDRGKTEAKKNARGRVWYKLGAEQIDGQGGK